MLNISNNSITKSVDHERFDSLRKIEFRHTGRLMIKWLVGLFILGFILMFLPWTQNIRSQGNVTTLQPEQRPQTIHSIIAGRVESWFVREGDFVSRGDTILFISEIKDAYFDPNLLDRTVQQMDAKRNVIGSYEEKVEALERQIIALAETAELKIQQARNKVRQAQLKITSDSIDLQAAEVNYQVAQDQYERMQSLQEEGLKSLTDLENRRTKMQKAMAEMVAYENKLLSSRNELLNARMELSSLRAQYQDEIAKAQSEKYTALSNKYDADATLTKLENEYTNYSVRKGMYYITAPQDGYVTKAIQVGLGETLKEGEPIVSIMPADYELAVEMYIKPLDLPLLEKGQEVRIQFDGWPAIVFSGWPNTSYGTYGGVVFAIDNFISENGRYRILVAPDPTDHEWPSALRVGSGTNSMVLLNEVPVWYELWRQINGFPPDYYSIDKPVAESKK